MKIKNIDINRVFIGNSEIKKVYKQNLLVFEKIVRPVYNLVDLVTTNRGTLLNELNPPIFNSDFINFSGWSFIKTGDYQHEVYLKFTSLNDYFIIKADNTNLTRRFDPDAGTIMEPVYFNNCGFSVNVPLNYFLLKETYNVELIYRDITNQLNYIISVYYYASTNNLTTYNNRTYTLNSVFNGSFSYMVLVNQPYVYTEPILDSAYFYKYGANCSTTFLNQLYLLRSAVFQYPYGYAYDSVSQTNFINLKVNLYLCNAYRRRVMEGTTLNTWVPIFEFDTINANPFSITVA